MTRSTAWRSIWPRSPRDEAIAKSGLRRRPTYIWYMLAVGPPMSLTKQSSRLAKRRSRGSLSRPASPASAPPCQRPATVPAARFHLAFSNLQPAADALHTHRRIPLQISPLWRRKASCLRMPLLGQWSVVSGPWSAGFGFDRRTLYESSEFVFVQFELFVDPCRQRPSSVVRGSSSSLAPSHTTLLGQQATDIVILFILESGLPSVHRVSVSPGPGR
jgi:hypothetical protein